MRASGEFTGDSVDIFYGLMTKQRSFTVTLIIYLTIFTPNSCFWRVNLKFVVLRTIGNTDKNGKTIILSTEKEIVFAK